MGVTCNCFGKGRSDGGEGEGSNRAKKSFLQKVVKKFKSVFYKGQAENAASNGGSKVAAAEPLRINTAASPGAISMQHVNPIVNNQNSSHSESQQNKATTVDAGHNVPQQRKSDALKTKRSKPLAIKTLEAKAKHLAASSEEEFKDCIEKLSSSEDEDVCPTCLEEYDEENPKIKSECNHYFHLSCIFEWMERSPSCPVCNKVMAFEPMT